MNVNARKLFPEVDNLELLNHQLITKKDLLNFSNLLFEALKEATNSKAQIPQWLKSSEVRKLLKISPGTLQTLRINGTLQYNRIGGIIYYKYDDISKLLDK
ncbi:helix-turn-helix domain-containing protein [Flavobacterium seoulense]|uniref:Helix-turn-helix domain-containing protein n=1 Tax=Flavobacterium seoulense TaxID=1492738 RepID=A0A066WVR3_9FLAO|nr:helix-turn-helix domain-containing protein [Flavobacterium seoulense]KDN56683.1 hypothetical protein FEM21_01860 [Flavobacterium seoulense]